MVSLSRRRRAAGDVPRHPAREEHAARPDVADEVAVRWWVPHDPQDAPREEGQRRPRARAASRVGEHSEAEQVERAAGREVRPTRRFQRFGSGGTGGIAGAWCLDVARRRLPRCCTGGQAAQTTRPASVLTMIGPGNAVKSPCPVTNRNRVAEARP